MGRRKQIEESSSRPTAHVAEGFSRFNPADFARFCVIARSSLMEAQNHLLDFVDKRYISENMRLELNELAETALEEVTGLMEYLSLRKHYATRAGLENVGSPHVLNAEARTKNVEPRTEPEP
jgi:four helix bundle protein